MADFKGQFAAPTPTLVSGARLVPDILPDRIKVDIDDEIYQYDPNANSLTLLLQKLRGRNKRKVSQFKFHWMEKDRLPRYTKATTAQDADDTTVSVTAGEGKFGRKFALVRNVRSGDVFLIDSVSVDTWTIRRNIGSSAAPIEIGDKLEILGTAFEEYADVGAEQNVKERLVTNQTQIIRTPFSYSGRVASTEMYGGRDVVTERRWQAIEHAISIEYSMFWSKQDSVTGPDGRTITTMDGVDAFVADNVWDVNGIPFNERSFIEWMEFSMRYGRGGRAGSRHKFLFTAPRLITEIESWGREKLYYRPSDETFGIDATDFVSAHGKVTMIGHPLLEERGDVAFLLDLNHISYVYHQDRDTQLLIDRGLNGRDGHTDEFLSDVSIQVELTSAHGKIRNF